MRILVACEFSGIVRDAFSRKGHDAWSCDLLDTEIYGNHIKDDVLKHLNEQWDLMIAFPPCTYFANSGVRWLYEQSGRFLKMAKAGEFWQKIRNAPIHKICIENPIPHKYAKKWMGNYDQLIQPWQFGHPETKATCLWLKNLPLLKSTNIVNGREGRVWKESPGPDRWKNRSRTLPGIAKAMADQWGEIKCLIN